ncbi:unnamed protein product, partial [Choristocarpus tenellus]
VVDAGARGGPVFEWEPEDDGEGDQVSSTFSGFLEDFRDQLLSGHFEFVEGLGVVERLGGAVGGGSPPHGRK